MILESVTIARIIFFMQSKPLILQETLDARLVRR